MRVRVRAAAGEKATNTPSVRLQFMAQDDTSDRHSPFMSIPEVAARLGKSRERAYALAKAGELPVTEACGRLVVPRAAFAIPTQVPKRATSPPPTRLGLKGMARSNSARTLSLRSSTPAASSASASRPASDGGASGCVKKEASTDEPEGHEHPAADPDFFSSHMCTRMWQSHPNAYRVYRVYRKPPPRTPR
jgi:predicted DNA-binding transcriptional regulator AlpA